MYNVLLIEKDERVAHILMEHLSQSFESKATCFDSAQEALNTGNLHKFHLIVCRNIIEEEETARKVLDALYDLSDNIPLIVLGELDYASGDFEALPDRFRLEEFNRLFIKLLGITKEELEYFRLPDYIPAAMNNFYLLDKAPCDIYICLKKKEGDQYIKRIITGDELDKSIIQKYELMGVRELFVKKENRTELMDALLRQSLIKLKQKKESGANDLELTADSYDMTTNLVKTAGVSDHTIRMARVSLQSIQNSIQSSSSLQSLLDKLLADSSSFAFKRCYLVCLFCFEVIPYMDWGSEEQKQAAFETMCFVSYFHDITLTSEKLLRINSMKDLMEANLDEEDRKKVMEHANEASTLVQSYPKAPNGADIIIRQHHGTKNGVGFVERYSVGLSPMAVVFIVVEDYVNRILGYEIVNPPFLQLLDEMDVKFHLSDYRKVVAILKKAVSKLPGPIPKAN